MPFHRRLITPLVLGLSLAAWTEVRAQCPDGTPPPCAGARRAPALNPRQYVVVPFANVTHATDLDWLRDASVNLLTLEVGRWTDVQVVDDKRVGDLLRTLPATARSGSLTLNDGMTIARRAGAGRLVMGDFIKQGRATRLVANVFDVRSGNRLRTVQQQAAEPDSLLSVFGPLARGVLDVPAPPDARTGDLGTASLDAYQAYLAGVRAMNRFILDQAQSDFERALGFDSTFALAHFQLSIVLNYGADASVPASRAHAQAAQRFGTRLPPRERALIEAQVGLASSDYGRACQAATPLVARDSSDVQALYMLGLCSYFDRAVIPGAADTLPGRFRNSWNTSLWAMTRVLQLDPTFHLAFDRIIAILRSPENNGCAERPRRMDATQNAQGSPTCESWRAAVLRDGDTLLLVPLSFERNWNGIERQRDRSYAERPIAANLQRARAIAEGWVVADPSSEYAHYGLATVLLRQGEVAAADSQLQAVNSRAYEANFEVLRTRLEVAVKLGRSVEARAWFDSLVKAIPDAPFTMVPRGSIEMLFGHLGRVTTGLSNAAQRQGPAALEYVRHVPRILLGLPDTALGRLEAAYVNAPRDTIQCNNDCLLFRLAASLFYDLRAPRAAWPRLGDNLPDGRFELARAVARGDTAALRLSTVYFDSLAHRNVTMGWGELGWMSIAAEGYLALHDSATALRTARFYVDSAMPSIPLTQGAGVGGMAMAPVWWRMMRLRADLAAAAGSTAEARYWYDRVIDLWSTADAELQPEVERLRAARAALQPR